MEDSVMRKIPFGIMAGIFAIICSFALIAIVGVFVISSMMYVESGGDDGLRDSLWIDPVTIVAAVSGVASAVCLVLYRFRENSN